MWEFTINMHRGSIEGAIPRENIGFDDKTGFSCERKGSSPQRKI